MEVIGYTRVSTAEQAAEGWTLAQQRRDIEAECRRRGWTLVEVIEDAGYTGRNDERPGMQRALMLLGRRRNAPKAIVVTRLDRLARSLVNLATYIDLSAKQGWGLVALDQELNTTTANGRLVARIIASVAQWESEINGERVREGMAEARASGKQFGYQAQVDQPTVQRIVRARKRGRSYAAIARTLDTQRVPPPGGGARWYPSTVERIYKRTAGHAQINAVVGGGGGQVSTWRWTDEDSRDLDERNRRMRRPPRQQLPVTTKEAQQVTARRALTHLDQFVSRPSRRARSPEEKQAKEWERTKRNLQAAGVRVVETPPHRPEVQPRMAKPTKAPKAARERHCVDCGADISQRGPTAARCEEHAYTHSRHLARERSRKNKENQQ